MIIDGHQHLWEFDPDEYGWIDDMEDPMEDIRRDFLPEHLWSTIEEAGVDRTIAVQARQTLEETERLLSLADENDFISGVVGWVPLTDPNVERDIEHFAGNPKLVGMRHIVQAEPDGYMLGNDFNRGVDLLDEHGLAYDILVIHGQLAEAIEFVDHHPRQRFVLDHIAKPDIRGNRISPWDEQMQEMAKRRDHVWCKLSGVATEADFQSWTEDQLRRYMDVALEAFGPDRLMYGSDWPVCLVAIEYRRWLKMVMDFIGELSETEQAKILGGNAADAYDIPIK